MDDDGRMWSRRAAAAQRKKATLRHQIDCLAVRTPEYGSDCRFSWTLLHSYAIWNGWRSTWKTTEPPMKNQCCANSFGIVRALPMNIVTEKLGKVLCQKGMGLEKERSSSAIRLMNSVLCFSLMTMPSSSSTHRDRHVSIGASQMA